MQRLLLLALVCSASPTLAEEYGEYILVPYSKTLDELVLVDVLEFKWPLRMDRGPYAVRDGKLYRKHADGSWHEDSGIQIAGTLFECVYDNRGNYFVPRWLYQHYSGRLPAKEHRGHTAAFQLPEAAKLAAVKARQTGELVLVTDFKDFEHYIWDANDKCWRFPRTLERVPEGFKLQSGDLLADKRPPTAPKGLKEDEWFFPLGQLAKQWRASEVAARQQKAGQ